MATVPLTTQQISDFESTGLLDLPAGNYSVGTTIDLGTCNGGRLSGAGQSYSPTETSNDKQVTRLFWTGTAGEPMIKGYIRGLVVEDIMLLDGRIWIEPKSGFGTGVCQFNRVSFFGVDGGVLFGGTYNGNAADSRFRDCQFNKCDPCIETTTSQNVNFGVSDSLFYRCGPVFLVNGGGLMNVDNCYMTQVPEVFNLTGNGTMTGSQNNKFSVTNIRYDANQDVKPKLVRDTGSYGDRVLTVINPHAPPLGLDMVDSDNATWTVKGLDFTQTGIEVMSATPIQGQGTSFNVSLLSQANGQILLDPTIEAGDFKVSTDGGSLAQLTNTPSVEPSGSGIVRIELTAAEVGSERFTVVMADTSGGEWKSMNYHESVADASDYKADVSDLALEQTLSDGIDSVLAEGGQGPWTTGDGQGSGGPTASEIYTYFTDDSREVPFQADVSAISAGVVGLGADLAALSTNIGSPEELGSGQSIAANISDLAGTGFSPVTDSLHAIRLRGDDAWVTADTGESVGANRLKAW